MVLIGFLMSPWHSIALVIVSLLLLDALVHGLGFAGQKPVTAGTSYSWNFISYSVVGYGIALFVSFSVLWIFGQTDGASPSQIAGTVTVLAFPAAIGAAIARLVV